MFLKPFGQMGGLSILTRGLGGRNPPSRLPDRRCHATPPPTIAQSYEIQSLAQHIFVALTVENAAERLDQLCPATLNPPRQHLFQRGAQRRVHHRRHDALDQVSVAAKRLLTNRRSRVARARFAAVATSGFKLFFLAGDRRQDAIRRPNLGRGWIQRFFDG